MKRIFILLSVLLFAHLSAVAQTDTAAYAVVKNMPVFYGQLTLPPTCWCRTAKVLFQP